MTCHRLERDGLLGHLGEQMDPHVEECGDCRTRRDEYARLAAALGRDSDRPLPADWKKRTLARLHAERMARRWRKAVRTGLAVTAAAALILIVTIDRTRPAGMDVSVEEGPGQWRGTAHLGDRLHIAATRGEAEAFELRIYRDARELLVRCPGAPAPACRVDDDGVEVAWTLDTAGEYQVLWLLSPSPLPAPAGDMNADLRAARSIGARVERHWSTDVY
jgi:hypothetical protein